MGEKSILALSHPAVYSCCILTVLTKAGQLLTPSWGHKLAVFMSPVKSTLILGLGRLGFFDWKCVPKKASISISISQERVPMLSCLNNDGSGTLGSAPAPTTHWDNLINVSVWTWLARKTNALTEASRNNTVFSLVWCSDARISPRANVRDLFTFTR